MNRYNSLKRVSKRVNNTNTQQADTGTSRFTGYKDLGSSPAVSRSKSTAVRRRSNYDPESYAVKRVTRKKGKSNK